MIELAYVGLTDLGRFPTPVLQCQGVGVQILDSLISFSVQKAFGHLSRRRGPVEEVQASFPMSEIRIVRKRNGLS
jgi:hypothetical protein